MRASVGPTAENLMGNFSTQLSAVPELRDSRYDYTHPWWQNANDRVWYERAFYAGTFEERQIAQAALSSDPLTPNSLIRSKNKNAGFIPPKYGYRDSQFSIEDILDTDDRGHLEDAHSTDFSGRLSNIESTSRPGIFW
jgi:hypothetical protein